jgi:hypothetical protein
MRKTIFTLFLIIATGVASYGQSAIVKDFEPVCDSLDVLLKENRDVKGKLRLKNIMKRGNTLDFYFTESLGDYPWREGEPEWFRRKLENLFPEKYKAYRIGAIYSKTVALDRLVTSELGHDGKPTSKGKFTPVPSRKAPLVREYGARTFPKGLKNKNIAVWQSHGRYFDYAAERWQWQRPPLFQTVEDMFTQSFVLPYLVPMLENAGGYVLLPRERDTQRNEVIADFDVIDEAFGHAHYKETGKWTDAGAGFAALKPVYTGIENPFTTGSVRKADCIMAGKKSVATALWRPQIPERGEYAVYISYKSFPESTSNALYTVHHMGGETAFIINQKIGGGTWIYLGTFEFDKGSEGYVSLTNETPEGYDHEKGSIVTADAVRFGGGMGNIARARKDAEDEPVVSGLPRSAEGARYWLQWAGVSPEIFSQNEQKDDYRDDYMSRGDWVEWISRGSDMNPSKKPGKAIPVDLSLGFHSDAGVTPNDSIVGTLAIYTLRSEGKEKLPGGESRMSSREFADLVQSQIVSDIQALDNPDWSRRCVWDRGYRESRTPSCPSMLLELLSHQNFADMQYGLDPAFRFTVSRSIYKAMLKYLSNRYGTEYAVQPLPVGHMSVTFSDNGKAVISWKDTEDPLEPTADASGYILYTRIDDGGFDTGKEIKPARNAGGKLSAEVTIEPGRIYSFRIAAFNEGGISFSSETVSIGTPDKDRNEKNILIVNNFDRISGPAFIDTPSYAGFRNDLDSGVPHIKDIAYIGEMYQYRRDFEFVTNDNPGFGASFDDYAGRSVAGNSFDYPYIHGRAFLKEGYSFTSCSNEAFSSDTLLTRGAWSVDLICGKQVTTVNKTGGRQRYQVFPTEIQDALRKFTSEGGNLLVSGAYIATDIWDQVYPIQADSTYKADSKAFAREVLGYRWVRNHGSRDGSVRFVKSTRMDTKKGKAFNFHNSINEECYCVESPDGITPVSAKTGSTFLRYADTDISAGVCYEGKGYKAVSLGFPIETLEDEKSIDHIIRTTLDFFNK